MPEGQAPQGGRLQGVAIAGLYAVSGFFWVGAAGLPVASAAFPRVLAVVLAALNTAWLVELVRGRRHRRGSVVASGRARAAHEAPWRGWAAAGLAVAYGLLLVPAGYLLASAVVLAALMQLLGQRDWRVLVGVAAGWSLTVHLAFQHLLGVPVPRGPLGL